MSKYCACQHGNVPPHVGAALDNMQVLVRAVQVVLLPVLPDTRAHLVLQLDRNRVLGHIQVCDVRLAQLVAEELPSSLGHFITLSNVHAPDHLLL